MFGDGDIAIAVIEVAMSEFLDLLCTKMRILCHFFFGNSSWTYPFFRSFSRFCQNCLIRNNVIILTWTDMKKAFGYFICWYHSKKHFKYWWKYLSFDIINFQHSTIQYVLFFHYIKQIRFKFFIVCFSPKL